MIELDKMMKSKELSDPEVTNFLKKNSMNVDTHMPKEKEELTSYLQQAFVFYEQIRYMLKRIMHSATQIQMEETEENIMDKVKVSENISKIFNDTLELIQYYAFNGLVTANVNSYCQDILDGHTHTTQRNIYWCTVHMYQEAFSISYQNTLENKNIPS